MKFLHRLGRRLRTWLIALGVLGLLIGAVAAAGGFEPGRARVDQIPAGQWFELTRWRVRVDSCQAVADPEKPKVIIELQVENTWTASQYAMNSQAMRVVLPNGERFGMRDEVISFSDAERGGDFDPGFERPARITLDPQQLWDDDGQVRMEFATEKQRDGFVIGGSWVGDQLAAEVLLDCPVVQP